jgi:hypothetical protein
VLNHRSILARLMFSAIAFVLICGIVSAELPECLSLTDNTTNDFTVRKNVSIEHIHLLRAAKQGPFQVVLTTVKPSATELWTATVKGASAICTRLFIFHSVLRT